MEVVTEEDPPEVIETLEKGDYFGEMFLIHACPQKMSLRAVTHVDMLVLSKEDLDALLVHDLHVAKQVSEVAERLYPNPSKTKWCAYLSATINPHSFIIFHHYNDIPKKNSFKTVFDSGFKAKYIHFWVFSHLFLDRWYLVFLFPVWSLWIKAVFCTLLTDILFARYVGTTATTFSILFFFKYTKDCAVAILKSSGSEW